MDPEAMVAELADRLEEIAAFLRRHGERQWSASLEEDAAAIRRGAITTGVRHFYHSFGGMGSITDRQVEPLDFDPNDTADDKMAKRLSLNKQLDSLLGGARHLAGAILGRVHIMV